MSAVLDRPLTVSETPPRRRHSKRARRESLAFYGFISPWIIGFLVFTAIPMGASLWYSFTDWDLFQPAKFIGIDNYKTIFTGEPLFWKALWHTFYFAMVSVPLSLLIALLLANLLAKPMRGAKAFRTIIYLPSLVPLVAAAMIFRWLLAPDTGPINRALGLFGIQGPAWLLDENWVIPAIILLGVWQVGQGTILLIAAIQGVPGQLVEAARLDGASRTQVFWHLTVPLVTPILFFNLITGIIAGFQVFSQVYVLTDGTSGPDNASLMLVPYIYQEAFRNYNMGYASALSWVLFALIVVLSLVVMRSSRSWVFYETEVD